MTFPSRVAIPTAISCVESVAASDLVGFNNGSTLVTINTGGLVTTSDNVTTHITNLNLSGGTLASGAYNTTYGSYYFANTPTVNVTTNSTISAIGVTGSTNFSIAPGTTLSLTGYYGPFGNSSGGTGPSNLAISGDGTMLITGDNSTDTGTVSIASGSTVVVGSLSATGALPTGAITDAGTLKFSANNSSNGILVRTIGSLGISSNATASIAQANTTATRTVLVAAGLSIAGGTGAWNGQLDLANNDMIVQAGSNTSLSNIINQVAQGYNGGTWNGPTGNSTPLYGSGAAVPNTFDGVSSTGEGDVLIKYTYYGDTNLDGKVDGGDYSRIDAAVLSENFTNGIPASPASGWFNGDFNYDGVVNGSDYTLLDNAFNSQGAQIAELVAGPNAEIAAQINGGGSSAVPEPATLSLVALGSIGLLGRRRRRV